MKKQNGLIALFAACGIFGSAQVMADDAAASSTLPEWSSYMKDLVPIGERYVDKLKDPNDPVLRQRLYMFSYEMLAQGYFNLLYQDAKHPDFWPMFNQVFPVGFANPDDSYYQALLEGDGVYKISGYRGTTYMVDFQVGSGDFTPRGEGRMGPTQANYDLDRDVHVKKDGSFEVILSPERPTGWKGDWWKLSKTATFLWVRQIAYDWVKEVDGRFAIERLNTPAIKPRDTAEEIAVKMKRIPVWTDAWTKTMVGWNERTFKGNTPVNAVDVIDFSNQGGISTQRYIMGVFDIQADEALVLETEIPKPCRYWMFQLTDELTDSIDWTNRQSTVNGHSARLDKDGKFRAVISSKDPGVPNWLDVADYQRGLIVGRWKECASYPKPSVQKVKVADVRKYLPADTPLVTPEARDAHIRVMRKAVQLRRRW